MNDQSPVAEYNEEQLKNLAHAGVSRPEDLPTPFAKLHFANAETRGSSVDPLEGYRLNLDVQRMEDAGVEPSERIELQHTIDLVSKSRFERAKDAPRLTLTDSEYFEAMRRVLPFADPDSVIIINRMMPFYAPKPAAGIN